MVNNYQNSPSYPCENALPIQLDSFQVVNVMYVFRYRELHASAYHVPPPPFVCIQYVFHTFQPMIGLNAHQQQACFSFEI